MAQTLQDRIERDARFASDVSHELRSPLMTLSASVEVMNNQREELPDRARSALDLMALDISRFQQLVEDLLEISRFDAGAAALEVEERDMRDIVHRVVEANAILAERKGSAVRVDVPPEPCSAEVDPRRVERVLRNLLANAIEHGEGRPVEITVAGSPSAVAVRVLDHGVGMSPEDAAHAFDRFWRADPARARTTGGTGLGLAISQEDARLHGGTLEAWGEPGVGAAFRLTLPRHAGAVMGASPVPLSPHEGPTTTTREVSGAAGPAAWTELAEDAR
jgi:two-component system sensor histidine kinase MtrB